MVEKMNRCWGITRNLHFCQRQGEWRFFCAEHKRQPIVWIIFLVFTVFAGGITIYRNFCPASQVTHEQEMAESYLKEQESELEPFDEKTFGILIAPFGGDNDERRQKGIEIRGTIEKTLNARFREWKIPDAEARAIPTSVSVPFRNHQEAREIGNKFRAQIVIWGDITLAGIIPNLTIVSPVSPASLVTHSETTILKDALCFTRLQDITEIRLPALTDEPLQITTFIIGIRYYIEKKYDDALHYLLKSVPENRSKFVESGVIFFFIANIYKQKGKDAEAILAYGRSIEINPNIPDTYYNRGNLQYLSGNFDEAISDYTKTIKLNPGFLFAYNNRGRAYKSKRNVQMAMLDYKMCLRLDPTDEVSLNNIATLYAEDGYFDLAIAFFDKALVIDAKSFLTLRNRGKAYVDKGEYDKGISDYNMAIEIAPNVAKSFNMRGIAYTKKGEYDLAIADYTKATVIDPTYAEAYNNFGNLYRDQGNIEKALSYYEEALRLSPDNAKIYYNRGIAYKKQGDFDRSIHDYKEAIKLNPDFPRAYYNLGLILLSQATGKDPKRPKGWPKGFLDILIDKNKAIEAEQLLRKAVELDPNNAAVNFAFGHVLRFLEKHEEAKKVYRKAIKLEPKLSIGAFGPGAYYPELSGIKTFGIKKGN